MKRGNGNGTTATRQAAPGGRIAGERAMLGAMGIDAVGSGMYIPFSLVFFHHITGLSFAVVGAVLTTVGLIGMTALPLAGTAVDRYGARRVALVLYAVRGTGFALYPLATALPAFAAVALGTAFGDRAFPAVQQSWIGEVATGADRDRLQAASRALRNAGLGAGALLASLVISLAGDRGFTFAAWLNAASFAAAALLMRRVRPAARPATECPATAASAASSRDARQSASAGYRLVLADRAFLGLTGANFLAALGYSALPVLFPLFIGGTLGQPQALTGAAFTMNTVLCAIGGVTVARAVRRRGARRTRSAALGTVLYASAFAGLALLGTVRPHAGWAVCGALFALIALYTVAEMVHNPSAGSLAVAAAPEALRGRYMATYQLSWSLASTLAPSLFTALIAVDARLPWLLLVATALSSAALLVRLERRLPAAAVRLAPPAPAAVSTSTAQAAVSTSPLPVLVPVPAPTARASQFTAAADPASPAGASCVPQTV
jgi:MFS family permease